jgi:hypothetical protein
MNGRQTIQFANKKKVSSWPSVASTDLHRGDDPVETRSVGASIAAELVFLPDFCTARRGNCVTGQGQLLWLRCREAAQVICSTPDGAAGPTRPLCTVERPTLR